MQITPTILPVGTILQGRYIVEHLLGKGGFGAVYLVRDRRVQGNLFAVKEILDPNMKERQHFAFEGNLLARLDHPSLPHVYRTFEGEQNGRVYMLMDYVEGPNLEVARQHQPDKRYALPEIVRIIGPVVSAVRYLHQQKVPIVHRDIKPSNIIISEHNNDTVLVDFGIAKEYDIEATTTAIRRCSPGYGAPEQYAHGTNPQTDIYGLAATIYALLTGQVPADAFYRMTRLGSNHPDPLIPVSELVPEVPQHISAAIVRAMAITSSERFATVEAFWQALCATSDEDESPEVPMVSVAPIEDRSPEVPMAAAVPAEAAPDVSTKEPVVAAPALSAVPPDHHISSDPPHVENIPLDVRTTQPRERKRRVWLPVLIAVALVALLGGVAFSSGLFPVLFHQPGGRVATSVGAHRTAVRGSNPIVHPTAASTRKPVAQSTTVPSPTPSSAPVAYPAVASVYTGTIIDMLTTPPTNGTMTLSQMQRNGANIHGTLALSNGLQGDGPLTGMVSTNKGIQFTVPGLYGHLPLLFKGRISSNGSMSGTYCSYRGNNQCDYNAGGYGDWNVSASSGGS